MEFLLENLKISQATFRRTVRATLQDENYVGESSLEFELAEKEFPSHACYLGCWVAKSKTQTKRPNT